MSDARWYRMARALGAIVLACVLLGTLLSDGVSALGKGLVVASLGVPALLLFVGVFGALAYQRVTGLAPPRGGFRKQRGVLLTLVGGLSVAALLFDVLQRLRPGSPWFSAWMASIAAAIFVVFVSVLVRRMLKADPPDDGAVAR